jgi:hypothetical protein
LASSCMSISIITVTSHTDICRCISSDKPGVVYAGVFIATCGIYPAFPGNITWLSNNLAGSYKRSAGMAIHIGIGNLAGGKNSPNDTFSPSATDALFSAMASNFYRAQDSPRYILGHALEIGFIAGGMLAVVVLVLNYKRINAKRERQLADGLYSGYTPEEMSALGDRSPTFRYIL